VLGLAPLFVAALVATGADSAVVEARLRVVYWRPGNAAAAAAPLRVGQALERNLAARKIPLVDGNDPAPAAAPLLPELTAARDDYRAFRFAEALARLDALETAARAAGGGELDTRQLADIYLYRGLARTELGQADAAWDDFVHAARLEPARLLDPARFAPRAVAAYARAAAEARAVSPAAVELAPASAQLRVDGRDVAARLALAPGSHWVRAVAEGLAPWAGAIEVTAAQQRIELPLTPLRPSLERLAARAGGGRALTAVVTRERDGWRLQLHDLGPGGGSFEAPVDADSAERAVDRGLHQLLDPAPVAHAAPPRRKHVPWWVWSVAGTVAAAAIVVPIAVVYGQPGGAGSVGGTIGALR
jgi:hypothetical protein